MRVAHRTLRTHRARVDRERLAQGRFGLGELCRVRVIAAELKKYGQALERKPRWLLFNKVDLVEDADKIVAKALRALRWKRPWFKVSAISGEGCGAAMKAIARELAKK